RLFKSSRLRFFAQKGTLSAEKGGVFIDPKWIQNWAPNLKSIWSSQVSGGQGGATACVSLAD
ncbi:unnamed protein product, partial [Musa textilis]